MDNLTHVWGYIYDKYYTTSFNFLSHYEHITKINNNYEEIYKKIENKGTNLDTDYYGVDDEIHYGSFDQKDYTHVIILNIHNTSMQIVFPTKDVNEFISTYILATKNECDVRLKEMIDSGDDEDVQICNYKHELAKRINNNQLYCCKEKYDIDIAGFRIVDIDKSYPKSHSEWQDLMENSDTPVLVYVHKCNNQNYKKIRNF